MTSRTLRAAVAAELEPGKRESAIQEGRKMARANVPRMPDSWIADGTIPIPPATYNDETLQRAFEWGFADESITILRELRERKA